MHYTLPSNLSLSALFTYSSTSSIPAKKKLELENKALICQFNKNCYRATPNFKHLRTLFSH